MKKAQAKLKPTLLKISRIIAKTSLPEIAFVTSLIFSKYLVNADFSYPSETLAPILFFALCATVIFYAARLILKSWLAARITAIILTYALYSYSYLPGFIKNSAVFLLPGKLETPFSRSVLIAVVIALVAGALGWLVMRSSKKFVFVRNLQVHKVILFALLFTSVVQFVKVANRLVSIAPELAYSYQMPDYTQDKTAITAKPDIYYFVFDRYANSEVLKNNFSYDNSSLMGFLDNLGFTTRTTGNSNYPFTMQSISSTLALNYHTQLGKDFNKGSYQAAFPYRDILNNPPVASLLRQNGYTYNQVASWWDFTRVAVKADNNLSKSFRLRVFGKNYYFSDLTRDIVNKSIMSPWLKKGMSIGGKPLIKYDKDDNPRQNFFAQKAAIEAVAGKSHAQPQFTFAHFLAPHDPYIFDAEGKDPSYDEGRNDWGADEKVKYTSELTYINTQIEEMMSFIRERSPSAVIIIQADEGPYPKQFRYEKLTSSHYYDPIDLSLSDRQQKFGILASYYMPGVDTDVAAQNINSSVNAFRFVLKQYLGYKLDMLPDCQFSAGNKFQIFNFKNQTPSLQANPNPACASL